MVKDIEVDYECGRAAAVLAGSMLDNETTEKCETCAEEKKG